MNRLEDSLAAKDDTLQTERQEHDVTRKSLKRSQDECKELMKQIEEDRERINELQNDLQRSIYYLFITLISVDSMQLN